ncbi:MAG: hypothetical protein WCJ89_06245 [Actinomycetes bacterium]
MQIIVGMALGIFLAVLVAGFPIAYLVASKMNQEIYLRYPFLLASSLLFGFSLSAFAAVISYGTLGIDTYPLVFGALALISWAALFTLKKRWKIKSKVHFLKLDLLLLTPTLWAFFLVRNYWVSFTEPIVRAGSGPDTSQNLMAAISARSLGSTWWSQADNVKTYLGYSSLRDSVYDMFRYPSFRGQAGFDYMVLGSRWGLSVPYSQIIRFFGPQASLWEPGVVLLVALLTLATMAYGLFSIFSRSSSAAMITSVICISNAALLVQFFNGGLSQVWSLAGIMGVFITLSLVIQRRRSEEKFSLRVVAIFSFASWLILFATYVDAAIILAMFICLSLPVYYFVNRAIFNDIIKVIPASGLAVLVMTPVLTYATIITFDLRLRAAQGTGTAGGMWPYPSESLGFVDVFSQPSAMRSAETTAVGLFLTISILWMLVKRLPKRNIDSDFAALGITGLLTMLVGFVLSYAGRLHTPYIYSKISVYVAPIVVIAFIAIIKSPKLLGLKKPTPQQLHSHKISKFTYQSVLFALVILTVASSFNATKNNAKQSGVISYSFAPLMQDQQAQATLSKYNYLVDYIADANYLGIFADVHWISKAPNDILLKDRLDIPLRVLCYSYDANCKPSTPRIPDPILEKYGLLQYESPFTTREFAAFTPRDRYAANFKALGQPPFTVPERFIGGNPYYNHK